MLRMTENRSLLTDAGKILFFSGDDFLEHIVNGNDCFVCGAKAGSVPFNEEHVIPDWILRRYDLHEKRITVPGGSGLVYSRYRVPCCESCNALMGKVFEEPISDLVTKGYDAIVQHLKDQGPRLIFVWLNLIFLKTHLKDRSFLVNRDTRVQSGSIGEQYDWPELHHIHCVARSFYTGAELSARAVSSVLVFPAKTGTPLGDFDYADYHAGRSLLLRLGEVVFISVLNDSCGALNILWEDLKKLTGPLSPLQTLELLAHFSYANLLMENRPIFYSQLDVDKETLTILADLPELIERSDYIPAEFGEILYSILSTKEVSLPGPELTKEYIRQGRWTFLFDSEGRFATNAL